MKILNKVYKNLIDGPGIVKLRLENTEDLWYAYNLISKGDTVKSVSMRKVLKEAASECSREIRARVKIKLEICVEFVEYDNVSAILRMRGKNISENEFVRLGQFHTLQIELHRPFEIRKKVWDSIAIDILRQAANPAASADLAVVLITEGLANIFLVGRNITTNSCRIHASIPRKHGRGMASHESALNHFFGNVLQAFLKHVDFKVVRCAVIAGPGLTNEQFNKHLLREAERKNLRAIIENKSKLLLARANSAYKHSLGDVLDDPKVMKLIKDTNAAKEVKVLDKFFEMLSNDQDRAWNGPKHVEVANERMAIDVLLITDELFRNSDVVTRKKYLELVQSVKNTGGEALIFSSMHVSGERLAQISGIAAILRFPLPDLEDMDI